MRGLAADADARALFATSVMLKATGVEIDRTDQASETLGPHREYWYAVVVLDFLLAAMSGRPVGWRVPGSKSLGSVRLFICMRAFLNCRTTEAMLAAARVTRSVPLLTTHIGGRRRLRWQASSASTCGLWLDAPAWQEVI